MASRKSRRALAHQTAPTKLAAPLPLANPQQPPASVAITRPRLSTLANRSLTVVTPGTLTSALRELEFGRLELWCDFITKAKRDPVVRRAYEIRRIAVAGRRWTCKAPADIVDPIQRRNAEDLAKLISKWLMTLDVTFFMRVLDAIGTGISIHELAWSRVDGAYLPNPVPVFTREARWETLGGTGPEWSVSIRNRDYQWINTEQPLQGDPPECANDTPEQRRARFLIHVPYTEQGRPQDQGQFQAVAWYWLFKGKSIVFWLNGAERFGNPFVLGRTGPDATESQRQNILDDLRQMTSDSVGVTSGATDISILDSKAAGSTPVWSTLVQFCDEQIFIGLGVPPDLVKSGVNGSRAADVVKDGVRVEGSKTDAQLMWDSILRDCVKPIARYNRFPIDTPLPEIETVFDDAVAVPVEVISAGLATHDEIRAGAGLAPKAQGGDVYYFPPQPSVPAVPGIGYDPAAAPDGVKVADAALNGAQADQLQKIVINVASGLLPRDAGISMLMLTFQVTQQRAEELMGSAGNGFVPTPPTGETTAPTTPHAPPDIAPLTDATPAPGSAPAASPFPTSPLSAGGMPQLSTNTPTSPTSSPSPTSPRRFARVPPSGVPTS